MFFPPLARGDVAGLFEHLRHVARAVENGVAVNLHLPDFARRVEMNVLHRHRLASSLDSFEGARMFHAVARAVTSVGEGVAGGGF